MKHRNSKRPKISLLHDELPEHLQEYMQLTRLAEMGRMAGNIAHEINNPLMITLGLAENIEMMLTRPELPREDIRLQVVEIVKACQRMSRIINKMNRMSRSQKLRLHVVDLAEVALNAVDFVKTQLHDLDVRLEFDFSRPLPIKCDVTQVEQIVLNILSNAMAAVARREEGERRIRISFEEVGRRWQQIKIWNNGPAMPENVKSQLLSPFFSTQTKGTGLGLAVSKAIMEVHGGDLSFYSDTDLGTEFQLSFPRPRENPWKERERAGRGTVFILDRHSNYRRTLHEKFRLLGYHVESYAVNEEGFARIRECSNVAGVLMDILPGQSEEMAFVRRLRQHLSSEALIFTMSHFPSARDFKKDLKAAGATECFEKPIHAEGFALILKLLDRSSSAAQVKRAA